MIELIFEECILLIKHYFSSSPAKSSKWFSGALTTFKKKTKSIRFRVLLGKHILLVSNAVTCSIFRFDFFK